MRRLLLFASLALLGIALWWRKNPSACPYSQRFWVQAPHPFITREKLKAALAPAPGERVLEVGPGTGYYTLDLAAWLRPEGAVEIFDIQQEMLDHTLKRAAAAGLTNVTATQGDARELPYDDASFDAAVLITVLGEIPDQAAALRELGRILKPGGRLIIGELVGDPHFVSPGSLARKTEATGLRLESRLGPAFGYFARLVKS